MTTWLVLIIAYAAIANLAMYMTCREHTQTGGSSALWTMIGVAACTVWPLVIAAMMVLARRKPTAA